MSNKSQNTKNSTAVQLASNFNAHERIAMVEAALNKLNTIAETQYYTQDKSLELGGQSIMIQNCTDVQQLLKLDASVNARANAYNTAVQDKISKGLIQSAPVYTEANVTPENIVKDVDLRLQILSQAETREKLQKTMDGYKKYVTREENIALLDKEFASLVGMELPK